MRVTKGKYPDGSRLYTAIPTSTKEVKVLFLCNGIHAWLMKYGGKYDICYPNPKENGGPTFYSTGFAKVDCCTFKEWLRIAKEHCPSQNLCEPYDEKLRKWFKWPNVNQFVELETLP